MAAILLSWVGTHDMQASEESDAAETGPVMRERHGDIKLLAEQLLDQINAD